MVSLLEKLQKEMISAMKTKQEQRLSVLRMLITEIKNEDKAKGKKRDEEEIIFAYHKKLKKSLPMYPADKQEPINKEIIIVEEFLPKMMTKEEIVDFIKDNIKTDEINMKTIMQLLKGKADANLIKEIVLNWNK